MGILDEAIRDHLALKRRGGTQEADLRRLEKEAFGPPSRPGGPAPEGGARVQDLEALKEGPSPEEPPEALPRDVAGPLPEEGEAEPGTAAGGEGLFHDFAAEEGLVIPGADAAPPSPPEEKLDVEEPDADLDEQEPGEPRPPASEASLDDTQPHDMESELGTVEEGPEPESAEGIDEELELHLDDDESTAVEEGSDSEAEADEPSGEGGGLELIEEEELVEEDVELVEDEADEAEQGDDVLEETPEFLRETPEHDRLWFEQRPPKDFDFDED